MFAYTYTPISYLHLSFQDTSVLQRTPFTFTFPIPPGTVLPTGSFVRLIIPRNANVTTSTDARGLPTAPVAARYLAPARRVYCLVGSQVALVSVRPMASGEKGEGPEYTMMDIRTTAPITFPDAAASAAGAATAAAAASTGSSSEADPLGAAATAAAWGTGADGSTESSEQSLFLDSLPSLLSLDPLSPVALTALLSDARAIASARVPAPPQRPRDADEPVDFELRYIPRISPLPGPRRKLREALKRLLAQEGGRGRGASGTPGAATRATASVARPTDVEDAAEAAAAAQALRQALLDTKLAVSDVTQPRETRVPLPSLAFITAFAAASAARHGVHPLSGVSLTEAIAADIDALASGLPPPPPLFAASASSGASGNSTFSPEAVWRPVIRSRPPMPPRVELFCSSILTPAATLPLSTASSALSTTSNASTEAAALALGLQRSIARAAVAWLFIPAPIYTVAFTAPPDATTATATSTLRAPRFTLVSHSIALEWTADEASRAATLRGARHRREDALHAPGDSFGAVPVPICEPGILDPLGMTEGIGPAHAAAWARGNATQPPGIARAQNTAAAAWSRAAELSRRISDVAVTRQRVLGAAAVQKDEARALMAAGEDEAAPWATRMAALWPVGPLKTLAKVLGESITVPRVGNFKPLEVGSAVTLVVARRARSRRPPSPTGPSSAGTEMAAAEAEAEAEANRPELRGLELSLSGLSSASLIEPGDSVAFQLPPLPTTAAPTVTAEEAEAARKRGQVVWGGRVFSLICTSISEAPPWERESDDAPNGTAGSNGSGAGTNPNPSPSSSGSDGDNDSGSAHWLVHDLTHSPLSRARGRRVQWNVTVATPAQARLWARAIAAEEDDSGAVLAAAANTTAPIAAAPVLLLTPQRAVVASVARPALQGGVPRPKPMGQFVVNIQCALTEPLSASPATTHSSTGPSSGDSGGSPGSSSGSEAQGGLITALITKGLATDLPVGECAIVGDLSHRPPGASVHGAAGGALAAAAGGGGQSSLRALALPRPRGGAALFKGPIDADMLTSRGRRRKHCVYARFIVDTGPLSSSAGPGEGARNDSHGGGTIGVDGGSANDLPVSSSDSRTEPIVTAPPRARNVHHLVSDMSGGVFPRVPAAPTPPKPLPPQPAPRLDASGTRVVIPRVVQSVSPPMTPVFMTPRRPAWMRHPMSPHTNYAPRQTVAYRVPHRGG